MIIRETVCRGEIEKILLDPVIYDCISDDNCPPIEEFKAPIGKGYTYIGGYSNNQIFGVMIYHNKSGKTYCHIQVLPEYRAEFSQEFAKKALDEQLQYGDEVWAEIPTCYDNVLRFALSFGFRQVDKQKDAYLKNGEKSDIIVLRYNHGLCS